MGKIYFVAEIHCGEDVVTSPEIYNMKNDDGSMRRNRKKKVGNTTRNWTKYLQI